MECLLAILWSPVLLAVTQSFSPPPPQLERKRHIGNDIVVIIYVDYETDPEEAYRSATVDFDPSCMKSHFNHIFALVTYDPSMATYRLVLHSAESVPAFGPPLPLNGKFTDFVTFRDFLLAKCKAEDFC